MEKLIIVILLILVIGCTNIKDPETDGVTQASPKDEIKELEAIEVKDYEGEKLGSVSDFRENSIKGPQYIDISDYELTITGLVENPMMYLYDEVLSFPKYQKVVTLYCVEGWDVKILWGGILLKDLFEDASIKPEANTVIFYAYDGYSSSLPLDYIIENDIMIAYKMNNATLHPKRGFPFQLVAEDKWGYKWVKWITAIELSDDPEFKGFWEERGYNQKGDLDGPKREVR